MSAHTDRIAAEGCALTPGDPSITCLGCETPLPRKANGHPHPRRRWCSRECGDTWAANHVWPVARSAALKRDGRRCVRIDEHEPEDEVRAELAPRAAEIEDEVDGIRYGDDPDLWARNRAARRDLDRELNERAGSWELEVNHVVPRNGDGYGVGCWHHLDNLETLCRPHHVEETRRQRHGLPTWREDPRPVDVLLEELLPARQIGLQL